MTVGRPKNRKRTKGAITLRKDGRRSPWMYRYWVGSVRRTGYAKTRAIAEEKLNRALVLSADGMLSAEDPTFSDWSTAWHLSKRGIAKGTRLRYQYNLNRASRFFGSVKLSKLSPGHLEDMYLAMLDSGLSPSTVHQMHANVGTCLKAAYRKGMMNRDIAAFANAPSTQKRIPVILSRSQWKTLINESAKNQTGLIVEFALKTGMRIDVEVLNTTWGQIDFGSREVTVGVSKTAAGEGRVIPLDEDLLTRLRNLRATHRTKQLEANEPWNPNDWIFCSSVGTRLLYSNLQRRVLDPMLERAGLSRLTWHHLRYNCGSYLLSENVPITMVSKILGHANPSITMSIYAHELQEDAEQVRTAMAKFG